MTAFGLTLSSEEQGPRDLVDLARGPNVRDALLESVRSYVDAGYDHLYFHQIGPDQAGFLDYWQRELAPALVGAPV